MTRLPVDERPPLGLIRSSSLTDTVYKDMLRLIRDGSWPPRMRLPSEVELAKHFGISRPVVRQALARLREGGLIQSRQGSGSFVCNIEREPQVQFPAIGSIADLKSFLKFREGVEGEAAAMAAAGCSDASLVKISAAAMRLEKTGELELLSENDFGFHLAIAESTNNPFYINTLKSLRDNIRTGIGLAWNFADLRGDFLSGIHEQHHAVVTAIKARDPSNARDAMRAHLSWERARLMGEAGEFLTHTGTSP